GQHFVEQNSKRIYVRPCIALFRFDLFGRHVLNRADYVPLTRESRASQHSSDTEVHDFYRPGFCEHYVGGFDVAVNDAHSVGMIDSVKSLTKQWDRPVAGNRSELSNDIVQRLAFDVFHDHEILIALSQKAEQCCDVWMIESSEGDCFGPEALDNVRLAGKLRPQHLDGDFALEHCVDAAKHGAHSALANFFRDSVWTDQPADHS